MVSLEGRLQFGLSLGLACLMVGIWWLGQNALERTGDTLVQTRLQHDADALIAGFQVTPEGLQLGAGFLTPVYRQPYSGHYFRFQTRSGGVLGSRSLWDWDLPVRTLAPGETRSWQWPGPDGQRLLVLGMGFHKAGQDATLILAEDISALDAELARFQTEFAGLALLAWVLMLALQRLVIHRTFRQLRPVYRDIARLERGEIRALTEAVPREILPLVQRFNRLLTLFSQRLERSRNAAGNLAHALKGPIHLIRRQIEEPIWTSHAGARLEEQLDRIHRLVDRELKRARLAGPIRPGQRFDPASELPALIQVLQRMYRDKGLAIELQLGVSGPLPSDREDMLELLGNLLDNACKWATSRVRCGLEVREGTLYLRIEDDGPGCSEPALAQLGQRGVRLDEDTDGHGLGLSIVADIVQSYGGTIAYERGETLGGFQARVTLPLP